MLTKQGTVIRHQTSDIKAKCSKRYPNILKIVFSAVHYLKKILSLWFLSLSFSLYFLLPFLLNLSFHLSIHLYVFFLSALSSQPLVCSSFFLFSSNFSVNSKTVHWAIWTTTAFQALSLSKSCSVPLAACCWGSKTGRRVRDEMWKGKGDKDIEVNDVWRMSSTMFFFFFIYIYVSCSYIFMSSYLNAIYMSYSWWEHLEENYMHNFPHSQTALVGMRETDKETKRQTLIDLSICVHNSCFYPPYLTVMGRGVHAVVTLWSPHAELALVRGTVYHSGWS